MTPNAPRTVRSKPKRAAIDAPNGENAAKASKGKEVNNPTALVERLKSCCIQGSTGATAVKGTLRFMATSSIAAISDTVAHLIFRVNVFISRFVWKK